MNEAENDLEDADIMDPLGQVCSTQEIGINKKDVLIRNVDPNLLKAITLVDRKLTRLTLVAAVGFMLAWSPFAGLCLWEMSSPPTSIPTSMYTASKKSSHPHISEFDLCSNFFRLWEIGACYLYKLFFSLKLHKIT